MTPIFGHIKRMEPSRPIKQIFEFSEKQIKARSETVKWTSAIIEDIDVACITQTEITDWEICRYYIFIGNLVRS